MRKFAIKWFLNKKKCFPLEFHKLYCILKDHNTYIIAIVERQVNNGL